MSKDSIKLTDYTGSLVSLSEYAEDLGITLSPTYIAKRYADVVLLRADVRRFLKEIILPEVNNCSILEVGPMELKNFHKKPNRPEFFVDTRDEFEKRGNEYFSCDLSKRVKSDYRQDVVELPDLIGEEQFNVIVSLECLEHSPRIWEVPEAFHRLLKPDGRIFISVPSVWLRHHDPHPDFWRFTTEGLMLLFKDYFKDIHIQKALWKDDDGQTPIHLSMWGKKR